MKRFMLAWQSVTDLMTMVMYWPAIEQKFKDLRAKDPAVQHFFTAFDHIAARVRRMM